MYGGKIAENTRLIIDPGTAFLLSGNSVNEGSISIYMEDDWLVIEDTGIGICSEDLPRIFEKGFTGYNGRSDKKSTGIGLYLCKQIIEKLRCQIRVESKLGKGTRVLLYLMKENLQVE